jgi:hypothetical protein
LNHPIKIRWAAQTISLLIMSFSPLPCYLVLLGPNTLLSTLFSKIFLFLGSKLEDKRFCTEW